MPPRKRPRHDSDLASAYRALAGLGLSAAQCTQVCDILKANPELVDEAAPTRMRMLRILADACQPLVLTESMQLTDGSDFNLDYLCPVKIIGAVVEYNADVSLAMADAFRGRQFVTLTLVVTSDETFSGNPLHEAGRKFWALSFSFAEFGSRRLTQSVFWWTPLVVRSKKLKLIPGGASRLFALCLQQMMLNEIDGLCCAGLPLTVDGRNCVLFCRFGAAFGDGDALKILLEWKGGGGLRPCFKCSNMWLAGSDIARRKAGDEEITVTRKSAFQLRTSASLTSDLADLLEARRLFQSRRLTKGKYTDLCKVLGFEPSEHGVWTFPRVIAALKLPDSMLFDRVHSAIQDGMFQAIFSAYLQEVQGGELDSVKAFLHGWTWMEGNNGGGVAKLLDIFAETPGTATAGRQQQIALSQLWCCGAGWFSEALTWAEQARTSSSSPISSQPFSRRSSPARRRKVLPISLIICGNNGPPTSWPSALRRGSPKGIGWDTWAINGATSACSSTPG